MQKILMMTTDQMIDRRILLESDALVADGWEVTILAMPGATRFHCATGKRRSFPPISPCGGTCP
jgi:hypothetical protein